MNPTSTPKVMNVAGRRMSLRRVAGSSLTRHSPALPPGWSTRRRTPAGNPEERSFAAPRRRTAGQRQEERFEVASGLEARGVDARLRQRSIDLGRATGVEADREPAFLTGNPGHAAVPGQPDQDPGRRIELGWRDPHPDDALPGQQLLDRALADEPPGVDDPDDVDELLDLAQDVARDEDRLAGRGEMAQRLAHGHDPRRVEAVGGFIEEQQPRVAEQGRGDAQSLLHAQRIALDLVARALLQTDEVEQLLDPTPWTLAAPVAARARRFSRPDRYG